VSAAANRLDTAVARFVDHAHRDAVGTSGADASTAPDPPPPEPDHEPHAVSAEALAAAALGFGGPLLDRRWFAVRLKPALRRSAMAGMEAKGFAVHAPLLVLRATARERRSEPLFGDYVFVAFDPLVEGWVDLRYVPGVRQLLCRPDGMPAPMPAGYVERLIAAGDVETDTARIDRIPPGTPVRIVAGPLAGLVGLAVTSTAQRVRMLVEEVMGGTRELVIDARVVGVG